MRRNRHNRHRQRRMDNLPNRNTSRLLSEPARFLRSLDFKRRLVQGATYDLRKRLRPSIRGMAYKRLHGPLMRSMDRRMQRRIHSIYGSEGLKRFNEVRRRLICTRRKLRRVQLFMRGHVGRGVRVDPRRQYNEDSKVRC